ncbi:metallophosphoesterase [Paraburkholderia sp. 32]|uniref:metallophosphoesterase n=1 Tax=Paraburkholderia sp. 32 TaxID=2991057 RepID=UPI003D1EDAE5
MKLHIVSDLHMHHMCDSKPDARVQPLDADVLILAGDIDRIEHVQQRYAAWPYDVVYVRGNHDTYFACYEYAISKAVEAAQETARFKILERRSVTYSDVRILGCCLWTDFCLLGRPEDALVLNAFSGSDYKATVRTDGKRLTPEDTALEHRLSVEWLDRTLKERFTGATVVVTHHAPHERSLDPQYGVNSFSTAFASDLSRLMRRVSLWIHGHIHYSSDYKVKGCRIICNPAGPASNPNPRFSPDLIVTV